MKIRVQLNDKTSFYSDGQISIRKGEIKEVNITHSLLNALNKGILVKVE